MFVVFKIFAPFFFCCCSCFSFFSWFLIFSLLCIIPSTPFILSPFPILLHPSPLLSPLYLFPPPFFLHPPSSSHIPKIPLKLPLLSPLFCYVPLFIFVCLFPFKTSRKEPRIKSLFLSLSFCELFRRTKTSQLCELMG